LASNDLGNRILIGGAVLALLYFGRAVLVPIVLAVFLNFVITPIVRALRRAGLSQVPATLIAALGSLIFLVAMGTIIGFQVAHIASSLPEYEETLRSKFVTLRELTLGPVDRARGEASKVLGRLNERASVLASPKPGPADTAVLPATPVPVIIQERPATSLEFAANVLTSAWVPLQTAGIVLVVLIFLMLEHEAFRDRFIRLVGGRDLRATTVAINDAEERLSRYFTSQFAVNFGLGAVLGLSLGAIGLPHAFLWGVLTAVLRFVPYIGVLLSALAAGLLAAAVDQGWSLVLETIAIFGAVETITTQWVEPQLYGHTTGLSPLSVVIAAIFWSWLWGPVGLVISTPLTLCLVVAGRYVKGLGFLDILLGDAPALTLPQRFYHRALSGDSDEIIAAARLFLKRKSFAAYCDAVLIRALQLVRLDLAEGTISEAQQQKVRTAVVTVIEALDTESGRHTRHRRATTVLEDPNLGRHLRRQREKSSGQWQGPLTVPLGSIVLAVGLGSVADDVATEILVRVLRDLHIDARHLSLSDLDAMPPPGAKHGSVSMVCIVCVSPEKDRDRAISVAAQSRRQFFPAMVTLLLLPWSLTDTTEISPGSDIDVVTNSFEETAKQAVLRIQANRDGTP
jgi:predicted PurR-regulated permease PerM